MDQLLDENMLTNTNVIVNTEIEQELTKDHLPTTTLHLETVVIMVTLILTIEDHLQDPLPGQIHTLTTIVTDMMK